jgi:hypothetical protein
MAASWRTSVCTVSSFTSETRTSRDYFSRAVKKRTRWIVPSTYSTST